MSKTDGFWRSFITSFLLAAVPVWILVALLVWYIDPGVRLNIIVLVASIPAFIAGVLAGLGRSKL